MFHVDFSVNNKNLDNLSNIPTVEHNENDVRCPCGCNEVSLLKKYVLLVKKY